jgi:hypothetical protein
MLRTFPALEDAAPPLPFIQSGGLSSHERCQSTGEISALAEDPLCSDGARFQK